MPTQNRGLQANGLAIVQNAIRLLEMAISKVGVESEVGKDVMKALNSLSKHITPGQGSPGVEQTALRNLMMQNKQDAPLLQALRSQGQSPTPPTPPAQAA